MSLNKYNIEKWYKMLTGKSVLHVNQDIGKSFSSTEVKGYYNNLMEKVTKEPQLVYNDQLPTTKQPGNTVIVFPVANIGSRIITIPFLICLGNFA